MTIRVLVAHRHALIADALSTMLSGAPGIQIVGVARTGAQIADALTASRPDVIVAGSLPDVHAAELVRDGVTVLMVAEEPSSDDMFRAMDAGVTGYLTMTCSAPQLADAVARVAAGEVVVLGVDGRGLLPRKAPVAVPADAALIDLTPREREILKGICAGRSNREIAKDLFISQHTVRTHVQNIRSKLKVGSKLEAALMAVQTGVDRAAIAPEPEEPSRDGRRGPMLLPAAGWRG